jgi:acyl-ACP thioesterase
VDADGAAAALVTIDWVLLDARGLPTRIPAEFEPVFGTTQTAIELGRVELDAVPADAVRARLTVRPQELDPMDHVNNAVYADWLEERIMAAGGGADVRAIPRMARLDYARAAEAGATVEATTWRQHDGPWSCRIADVAGADLLRARLAAGPIG